MNFRPVTHPPPRRRFAYPLRRVTCWVAALALLLAGVTTTLRAQSAAYDPPAGYYAPSRNRTGAALEATLHALIANHAVLSYSPGVWDALEVLDADPADPANRVIEVYSGFSNLIANEFHSGSTAGKWDREHLWCQSFFGYDANIKTDVFNLRPVNYSVNASRSNLFYDVSTAPVSPSAAAPGSSHDADSWEPRDADKGALARVAFYMAVCYDGAASTVSTTRLSLSEVPNVATLTFGRLSTLLEWNRRYPVTEAERKRNQTIYSFYQHNRNPFVDDRFLADQIFGGANTPQQAWLQTKFTAAELLDPALSGDPASPAGDGVGNLLKYAFNLEPRVPGAVALPVGGLTQRGGVTYQTLTHYVNRQATDLSFRYQRSGDLRGWTEVAPTLLDSAHMDADATDVVTVGVPVVAGEGQRFLRLVVSKP